jgi:hypothetical protein
MSTKPTTAAVIGGGIAGPVTAAALRLAGIDAHVYEAYPARAEGVGGTLALAPNGQAALAIIGAKDALAALGEPIHRMDMLIAGRKRFTIPDRPAVRMGFHSPPRVRLRRLVIVQSDTNNREVVARQPSSVLTELGLLVGVHRAPSLRSDTSLLGRPYDRVSNRYDALARQHMRSCRRATRNRFSAPAPRPLPDLGRRHRHHPPRIRPLGLVARAVMS